MKRINPFLTALLCLGIVFGLCGCKTEHPFVKNTLFKDNRTISISFAGPVDISWAKKIENYSVNEEPDPDILLTIQKIIVSSNQLSIDIQLKDPLDTSTPHIVSMKNMISDKKNKGSALVSVKKLYIGHLLTILIGAMLVNNYVFVKYLGLCVYLGVSQKKSTAIGMGVTFLVIIMFSTSVSWAIYQYILKPFQLNFLQIIIFIGMVSLTVQAVDTVLRKINPVLFKEFGVYLVLVISSCLILAVPLIMAASNYDGFESLMLSFGAGAGFFIALFLMACVRERLELANIPESYRGMPIAFIVSGLFALSFMGFSGMSIY